MLLKGNAFIRIQNKTEFSMGECGQAFAMKYISR